MGSLFHICILLSLLLCSFWVRKEGNPSGVDAQIVEKLTKDLLPLETELETNTKNTKTLLESKRHSKFLEVVAAALKSAEKRLNNFEQELGPIFADAQRSIDPEVALKGSAQQSPTKIESQQHVPAQSSATRSEKGVSQEPATLKERQGKPSPPIKTRNFAFEPLAGNAVSPKVDHALPTSSQVNTQLSSNTASPTSTVSAHSQNEPGSATVLESPKSGSSSSSKLENSNVAPKDVELPKSPDVISSVIQDHTKDRKSEQESVTSGSSSQSPQTGGPPVDTRNINAQYPDLHHPKPMPGIPLHKFGVPNPQVTGHSPDNWIQSPHSQSATPDLQPLSITSTPTEGKSPVSDSSSPSPRSTSPQGSKRKWNSLEAASSPGFQFSPDFLEKKSSSLPSSSISAPRVQFRPRSRPQSLSRNRPKSASPHAESPSVIPTPPELKTPISSKHTSTQNGSNHLEQVPHVKPPGTPIPEPISTANDSLVEKFGPEMDDKTAMDVVKELTEAQTNPSSPPQVPLAFHSQPNTCPLPSLPLLNDGAIHCCLNSAIQFIRVLEKSRTDLFELKSQATGFLHGVSQVLKNENKNIPSGQMGFQTKNLRTMEGTNGADHNRQEDASTFVQAIIDGSNNLRKHFSFSDTTTIICHKENISRSPPNPTVKQIMFEIRQTKNLTFSDAAKYMENPEQLTDRKCSNTINGSVCGGKEDVLHTFDLSTVDYLIVRLIRFVNQQTPSGTVIRKVEPNFTEFNPNKQLIIDHNFRLVACLVHSGDTPDGGHYWTIARAPDSNDWWRLEDYSPPVKQDLDLTLKPYYLLAFENLGRAN